MLLAVITMPVVADDVDRWMCDLKDPNSIVRKAAAEALGKLNDTSAVEPLVELLDDEDPEVRAEAAASLGKLNDTRAVEPLIRLLDDKDIWVKEETIRSLCRLMILVP